MQRANYGFDAPAIMRTFLALGFTGITAGILVVALASDMWQIAAVILLVASLAPLSLGLCMVIYGLIGKHRMRDFMISRIAWKGDERVLDIGTGRGLLLIAAAKKLHRGGEAVGIDIWRPEDLTGNSLEAVQAIVAAEGVGERAVLMTEDARKLSFPDASFDVVLSLYCIHNIKDKAEQRKACFQISRVLKPGGRPLIGEYIPTHDYADALREAGLNVSFSRSFFGVAFAPMWMVEAAKN
jgi:SAM-dependent methyltransferase